MNSARQSLVKPTVVIPDTRVIHVFARDRPPAAEADSGATLLFHTRDAYNGFFDRRPDIQAYLTQSDRRAVSNPATGPVFIRGTHAGEGLAVRIEKIALADHAFHAIAPGLGVLGDTLTEARLARFEVKPDGLWYEKRIRLPLRPMIGVIGVAPPGAPVPTSELGRHGGNMDLPAVTEGTTVHLPVSAAGGLLAIGDVHANMGAGEPFSGVNMAACVTVTVRRQPWSGPPRVWLETRSEIMTVGIEDSVESAIRAAAAGMTDLLKGRLGIDQADAVALLGAAGDIRLGQASKFGVRVSAYAAFPKSALRQRKECR